jgi:hypothetical protein
MAVDDPHHPPRITLPSLEFDLPLSEEKTREIHACLAKGRLKISLTHVDLASARLGDGYKYD